MKRPLDGIRVLDLTQGHGAAAGTMQLADFGAEVIKIEKPGVGDISRAWSPRYNGESLYFAMLNRGKKSVEADLATEEGRALVRELSRLCDVVVENTNSDFLKENGLDYETLSQDHPGLIYVRVTGFGENERYKGRVYHEVNFQAASGFTDVTGFGDQPPQKIGFPVASYFTANNVSMGVVMALISRKKTGRGQKISLSMATALFDGLEDKLAHYSISHITPVRVGNAHPMIAPYDTFETADGYLALGVSTDQQWVNFCTAIGREDLLAVEEYASNESRGLAYWTGLREELESHTRTLTTDELIKLLDGVVPMSRVTPLEEMVDHPQIQAREMVIEVESGSMGSVRMPGIPVKLYGTPGFVASGAPVLGQHTEEIKALLKHGI